MHLTLPAAQAAPSPGDRTEGEGKKRTVFYARSALRLHTDTRTPQHDPFKNEKLAPPFSETETMRQRCFRLRTVSVSVSVPVSVSVSVPVSMYVCVCVCPDSPALTIFLDSGASVAAGIDTRILQRLEQLLWSFSSARTASRQCGRTAPATPFTRQSTR